MSTLPDHFRTQEGLRTVANFLRNSTYGVKTKQGVQHDKRVDYFKGKRLVEKLLEDHKKWPKTLPKIQDKGLAIELADLLLKGSFFHRSEKVYLIIFNLFFINIINSQRKRANTLLFPRKMYLNLMVIIHGYGRVINYGAIFSLV